MNEDKPEKMPPVPPFVRFVASAVPMVFDDSLSYYEALCALWKYVQGMTDVINANATLEQEYIDKFNELKSYVENYFDNLDVQEEINNKLDAMAEDGTLQEIITQYIQANTAWCFDTVADMKAADNFINGSFAQTLGYNACNDGGGALYKIRTITNDDIVDEGSIIALADDSLVAELIIKDKLNVLNFGYEVESVTYDSRTSNVKNITDALRNAISFLIRRETAKGTDGGTIAVQIYFPDDFYYIDETIDLDGAEISLLGDSPAIKRVSYRIGNFRQKILTSVDGNVFDDGYIHLNGLNFENILTSGSNDKVFANAEVRSMRYCHANNYDIVLKHLSGVATIDKNYFLHTTKYFISGDISDAIITDNYINGDKDHANTVCFNCAIIGMSLISGNFIDFFKSGIVASSQIVGSRILGNVFDYINKPIDIGGVMAASINDNSFNHISKTYYSNLGYANTDPEATNDWYCITTRYTVTGLSIIGNNATNIDSFLKLPNVDANTKIIADGNSVPDFTKYGTLSIGTPARTNKNIRILDMEDREYGVAPLVSNTYCGQSVHYGGYHYKNKGSNDFLFVVGIDELEKGVFKNYTTAGGGAYSIDLSTLPNGAMVNSFIFEIRTARNYGNPQVAQYYVYRIGSALVVATIYDGTDSDLKPAITTSGTTLSVAFSGTVESDTSKTKQIFYRTVEEK